jgi:23S rRNA pseudouridine2457 synthase
MLILFNKPFNVLCQFTDKEGRKTLSDFIPIKNVYAAGRLDYDSEGLVILTDDGKFQNLISDPKHKLVKTYRVQIEGIPTEDSLDKLRKGILLKDGLTKPAEVILFNTPKIWERIPPIRKRKNIPTTWLEIKIMEGKNRQVRRMTAAIGHPTLRLIRYSIGEWNIDKLKPGAYKLF